MNNLHEIGLKFGTDKSFNTHSHKGFSYLNRYEDYFRPKRNNENNILELGVLNGNSIMTWHEYFPKSNIIGLDIDPTRENLFNSIPRIEIIIGSQDDKNIRNNILNKYKYLDIIIDDASHINELSIKSFNLYWPLLRNDGIYIIEDVPFGDSINTGATWPGQCYNNKDQSLDNKREDIDKFILDRIKEMEQTLNNVFSIHLYQQFILIIKKL